MTRPRKRSRVVTLGASECSYSHRVAAVMFSLSAAQTPRHIKNGKTKKKKSWYGIKTGSAVIFKCHIWGWGCNQENVFGFFFHSSALAEATDNRAHNLWLTILSPVSSCKCRLCCLWAVSLLRLCHTSTRGCQSRPGLCSLPKVSVWPSGGWW